jgi:sugar phosphate isomerase/epimerase
VEAAEPLNVKLGIENREALEEIPFDNEFEDFFREFSSPSVVYWHDIGHAQIKENLGFIGHRQHLESMSERLYGFHVHDVKFPGRDHQAPGSGMVDFAGLAPLVRPNHLKVFEFSPSMTPQEAERGVEHVKHLWGPE